jgi:hypothetical protein
MILRRLPAHDHSFLFSSVVLIPAATPTALFPALALFPVAADYIVWSDVCIHVPAARNHPRLQRPDSSGGMLGQRADPKQPPHPLQRQTRGGCLFIFVRSDAFFHATIDAVPGKDRMNHEAMWLSVCWQPGG